MQVVTRVCGGYFDIDRLPQKTSVPFGTTLDKKLKTTVDSFKSFVEAPFKAEVVVYETPEDFLE